MQKIVIPRLLWYYTFVNEIITTTLRIVPQARTISFWNTETTHKTTVHNILVWRGDVRLFSMDRFQNLSNTKNISVEIETPEWKIETIELSEHIVQWIIWYLQNSPKLSEATDCLGFIVEILGWKRGERFLDDGDFSYHWVTQFHSSSEPTSWDIILFCDGDEESFSKWNYHYTLYLGKGLFLSKLFLNWPIIAQTFEQLKEMNQSLNLIMKMTLRKKD